MAIQGIIDTARALSYHLRLQEVTANNLANANTDAFKADRLAAHLEPGERAPVPVQTIDLEPGRLRDTGRPLDLAIEGPGFLTVATDHGERLTRGGSLKLDPQGRITDLHGDPLMGADGPIVVQGSELEVHDDGTVIVDGRIAGRLKLVDVPDAATLSKEGFGRFTTSAPTVPASPGRTALRQYSIEEPNFDPMLSMVDLITIQREYAAGLDALRTMDGVLGTTTNEVGKL